MAVAASLLVAIASFVLVLSLPDARPAVLTQSGEIVPYGEPFIADQFTTLTLPGVGRLQVNEKATLTLVDPRTVELASGEVFAEIEPSGRGFEIRSDSTTARVHGTRFGFTAPSTVYVVEGLVEVRTPEGSLSLKADQAALGSRLLQVTPADYLAWLSEHHRPDLRVILDPMEQTTITPGAPLTWHVRLETNAIAPILLGDLDDLSQFLFLKVDDSQVSLDPTRARVTASRRDGRVRLDGAHPVEIEIAVDPRLFRQKGFATVRAVFTSGADAPRGTWVGSALSPPVRVEVR